MSPSRSASAALFAALLVLVACGGDDGTTSGDAVAPVESGAVASDPSAPVAAADTTDACAAITEADIEAVTGLSFVRGDVSDADAASRCTYDFDDGNGARAHVSVFVQREPSGERGGVFQQNDTTGWGSPLAIDGASEALLYPVSSSFVTAAAVYADPGMFGRSLTVTTDSNVSADDLGFQAGPFAEALLRTLVERVGYTANA